MELEQGLIEDVNHLKLEMEVLQARLIIEGDLMGLCVCVRVEFASVCFF